MLSWQAAATPAFPVIAQALAQSRNLPKEKFDLWKIKLIKTHCVNSVQGMSCVFLFRFGLTSEMGEA